jgi:addiction module HigA family antidote
MKLTDEFLSDVPPDDSKAGRKYSDGKALYLHVRGVGKYWRFAYRFAGKQKTLALGVYPDVSLDEARRKANSALELLKVGIDPSESKKAVKQVQRETALGLRPKHPGAMLRDVVLPGLSVSAESFADLLNLSHDCVEQLINERSPMTCAVALKLEMLLSVKAESWMTMQQAVDLWDARTELRRSQTELKRFQDFGKSLRAADFLPPPDLTQGGLDGLSTALVAKAVSLSKAAAEFNGVLEVRG